MCYIFGKHKYKDVNGGVLRCQRWNCEIALLISMWSREMRLSEAEGLGQEPWFLKTTSRLIEVGLFFHNIKLTTPQLSNMWLTLTPLVSLMYGRSTCIKQSVLEWLSPQIEEPDLTSFHPMLSKKSRTKIDHIPWILFDTIKLTTPQTPQTCGWPYPHWLVLQAFQFSFFCNPCGNR